MAAKALLDDVKARRDMIAVNMVVSPFPDLDRTLETLSGADGGFSFNLDPKLVTDEGEKVDLPDLDGDANTPFRGSYLDAFPSLKSPSQPSTAFAKPPEIIYTPRPNHSLYDPMVIPTPITVENQPAVASNYTGSFNPFAENTEEPPSSPLRSTQCSPLDDDSTRKVSRFGFAQGRRSSTAASSPLHMSSPLINSDSQTSFYTSGEYPKTPLQPTWVAPTRQYSDYGYPPSGSPLIQAQVHPAYAQQTGRFQPFESAVSEAQLRDLLQSSRDRSISFVNGPPGRSSSYV
jgi:CCR4-NOT transcription complex subunit 4